MTDSRFDFETRSVANPTFISNLTDSNIDETPPKESAKLFMSGLPPTLDLGSYKDIAVTLDPDRQTYWMAFRQKGVPSFTFNMLRELNRSHRIIPGRLNIDTRPMPLSD